MSKTFFFYDLETSGLNPRDDRIMQFAGQRTTLELEPIGDPFNILVTLPDDTLPSPDALMVTGITPQQTKDDGMSEADFAKVLMKEVFTEDTIVVGFNNIRFDDEFIRHLFWRTFYDPYEWSWKDGRSRWDLLDVVRMTRALRPEGITWPVVDGKPSNRLEVLTKENGIDHLKAHDALSDVEALIAITKLIKTNQPQLFGYLLEMRDKKAVKQLVNLEDKQPFVYVSGRYDAAFHKATVAFPITAGRNSSVVVYDLRHDPTPFIALDDAALKARLLASWNERQKDGFEAVPVKEFHHNKAPAVAPLGVLAQEGGWERISVSETLVKKHRDVLLANPDFAERIRTALEGRPEFDRHPDPEGQLYGGFLSENDSLLSEKVRHASPEQLADFQPSFIDERLAPLLLHYKARNFPRTLAEDEVPLWEAWRSNHLKRQLPKFVERLQALATKTEDEHKQFVLQEMQLWAESILPIESVDGE